MKCQSIFRFISIKVVLFTIVENYNDDGVVNHHGFKRNVGEKTDASLFQIRNQDNGLGINEKKGWKVPNFTLDIMKKMGIGKIAKFIGKIFLKECHCLFVA